MGQREIGRLHGRGPALQRYHWIGSRAKALRPMACLLQAHLLWLPLRPRLRRLLRSFPERPLQSQVGPLGPAMRSFREHPRRNQHGSLPGMVALPAGRRIRESEGRRAAGWGNLHTDPDRTS